MFGQPVTAFLPQILPPFPVGSGLKAFLPYQVFFLLRMKRFFRTLADGAFPVFHFSALLPAALRVKRNVLTHTLSLA